MRRSALIMALLAIAGGTVTAAYSSADVWARNAHAYKQRHQDRTLAAQELDQRIAHGASVAAIS